MKLDPYKFVNDKTCEWNGRKSIVVPQRKSLSSRFDRKRLCGEKKSGLVLLYIDTNGTRNDSASTIPKTRFPKTSSDCLPCDRLFNQAVG